MFSQFLGTWYCFFKFDFTLQARTVVEEILVDQLFTDQILIQIFTRLELSVLDQVFVVKGFLVCIPKYHHFQIGLMIILRILINLESCLLNSDRFPYINFYAHQNIVICLHVDQLVVYIMFTTLIQKMISASSYSGGNQNRGKIGFAYFSKTLAMTTK